MVAIYSIVFSLGVLGSITQAIPFSWRDCASDPSSSYLHISSIEATPQPLTLPGDLHLSFNATVRQPIPVNRLEVKMVRHAGLVSVPIPCVNNFGSCNLDGCSLLSNLVASSVASTSSLGNQVTDLLHNIGANLTCPIQPQDLVVQNALIHVPDLSGATSAVTDGDYTFTVKMVDAATGQEYGCLSIDATLKHKCEGWLCPGRRRRSGAKTQS